MSLPTWSGRRHKVALLQSSCHLYCTRPFPERLLIRVICTACAVPGSASVFPCTHRSLFLKFFSVLIGIHMYRFVNECLNDQMTCLCLAGTNALSLGPWILVEDLSSVYNDVELERGTVKHAHKKRKLTDGREKPMVRPDQK